METTADNFRIDLQQFQNTLRDEQLNVFRRTTLGDVCSTITSIQARQETERNMMNMARLRTFLDRMQELSNILRQPDGHTDYMAFVWGSLKAVLNSASQDQKALDILLNAYDRLGSAIPILRNIEPILASYPDLRKIPEIIYQDVLQFQDSALRLSTHPDMRTLFRYMWNDYAPQFEAKLKTLGRLQDLTKQIPVVEDTSTPVPPQNTTIFNFFAGNSYEGIELDGNSNAHFGNVVYDTDLSEILGHIRDLERSLEGTKLLLKTQEKQAVAERRLRIREWIAGSVPYKNHDRVYKQHCDHPQTGLWILENHLVTAWMKDDLPNKPFLWIHGIPGAGKTVLASILINACKELEDMQTAYFYCNYDDPETNTELGILKGLLMQIITWRPELMSYFEEQRLQGGEPTIGREQTARKLANLALRNGNKTCVVIDGVDECSHDDRKSILSFLNATVQEVDEKTPGKLRIMVISQNEPDIRKALLNAGELEIDRRLSDGDIDLYVEHFAKRIGDKFGLEDDEAHALRGRTYRYAAGQFLYATLVMKHLFSLDTLLRLRKEMEESQFPQGLSEAYERIMMRIKYRASDSEWNTTQKLLGWMTCAARPLKWHEMQGALSINFIASTADFEEESSRKHIHKLCGSLVSVYDDRISLVHMTARDFIVQSNHINYLLVDCQLTNRCIRYLTLPFFDITSGDEELRTFILDGYFAFADYAVAKWIYHVQRVVNQAQALADPRTWAVCEDDVAELIETMKDFSLMFDEDLQSCQRQMESCEAQTSLSPAIISLLERCSIDDAHSSVQKLWTHAQLFCAGDDHGRRITLQKLREAIEKIRDILEEEFSDKNLTETERKKLERYYGKKVYRCSKPSCFYFHQGFEDRDSRRKHVAKHDRPYVCSEPDCREVDFGFGDKKALQAHVRDAHPDSELKATMFGDSKIKRSGTKFRCEPCDQNFTRNAALLAHQRAHAGQKPFECSKCGKAFVRKSDCNRHEKTHKAF